MQEEGNVERINVHEEGNVEGVNVQKECNVEKVINEEIIET